MTATAINGRYDCTITNRSGSGPGEPIGNGIYDDKKFTLETCKDIPVGTAIHIQYRVYKVPYCLTFRVKNIEAYNGMKRYSLLQIS